MQSCGANSMARVYSPEEVVRRLRLPKPPCLGPLEDTLREFNMFVTENGEAMEKVREGIKSKPHKAFRLAYIQWWAFIFCLRLHFSSLKALACSLVFFCSAPSPGCCSPFCV